MTNNIIVNLVNRQIANIDRAINEGKRDSKFPKSQIHDAVWNSPQLKGRQKEFIANQAKGWPDIDAYSAYIYNVIERRLHIQTVFTIAGNLYRVPEFPSFEIVGQRERLYCRRSRITPSEMRAIGRSYLKLGAENTAKGKILLALADEVESKGLTTATDDLLKQVVETLVATKQLI